MFEVAQTPLHTLAIPSLWDEVLQLILSILELEGAHEGCGTFAAAEVGGKGCGYMWDLFEATFSQNQLSWRESGVSRKRRLSVLNEQLVHSEKKIAALDGDIKSASEGREDSADRLALLTKLEDVTSRRQQLSTELEKYKNCDPERLKEIRKETTVAMDAANRWTENVFSVKSWCKNKFGFLESDIDKQFGIP
ncbi:meiotic nuclear division protein 1 homolog [Dysidea avara]|uniref:meiotic nuclear division protein 1 homolog n=1 Tax=Dysidea avara TaxID=196820 RepID=UPI00331ED61A